MKAILTKRLPATPTKPARIKAYDSDGNQVVMSVHDPEIELFDHDEDRHRGVAHALVSKMGWWSRAYSLPNYVLHGGATKKGYAWVLV